MYKSPIDIIHGQLETQLEGEVLKAVQKCGVVVDKDELLKALAYDRDQYEQGYKDAMEKMRWIPVSERLPAPYTPVLTCRQEFGSDWRYLNIDKMILPNDNEDEQVWINDLRWTSPVTHWMSLPERP